MSVLSDRLNLIWYGDFEDHQNNPCTSFALANHTEIKRVYRTNVNTWPTYRKDATGNQFDTLECGYAYVVELEANQSINIPHANVSPYGSDARGLLVKEVELATPSPTPAPTPSPTPAPVGCIPSGYAEISHSSTPVDFGGMGNVVFGQTPGKFAFSASDFSSTAGASRQFTIFLPDGSLGAFVTATNWPENDSDSPMVYYAATSGECYGGNLALMVGSEPSREVTLELIGSGPSPTPSPSPTPVVATECGKPSDVSFGEFDLAVSAAESVGTNGTHRQDNNGNSVLVDLGDFAYLASIGVPTENIGTHNFIQFSHRPQFGDKTGKLLYNRKTDPRSGANYDGMRAEQFAFFEDQLPLSGDAMSLVGPAGLCQFSIKKSIKGDDEIFLQRDGKCWKATLESDADQALKPSSISFVDIVVFREI
jgi:hypothetical protein